MIAIDRRVIAECQQQICLQVWSPARDVVVLGNGDKPDTACFASRCAELDVPMLRRKGGGGAVVLHPHCIVISMGLWVRRYFHNEYYFQRINAAVVESLALYRTKLADLRHHGISDIAWSERKVGGTSIFRSRNYLLYQASLLHRAEVDKITALLPHPQREPDYRVGRTHAEFLCGLADIVPDSQPDAISATLRQQLPRTIVRLLDSELIAPPAEQCKGLLQRCNE